MKNVLIITLSTALSVFFQARLEAAPAAPTNAQVRRLPDQLHLTWQDNSNDEYQFIVERTITITQPNWQVAATLGPNRTSYQENNPISNRTYTYRVRALGEFGYSGYSNETSVSTSGVMLYSLVVSSPNGGEALPANAVYPIAWSNFYNPPAQVNLDYSLDAGTTWTNIKTNYPNTGIYYWKIPESITAEGLIRVRSSSDSTVYDLSNHVFALHGYDFDILGNQGWTISAVYDEDGYPIDANFRFSWSDTVEYPQSPGSDPLGNGQGSMAVVKNSDGVIYPNNDNPSAEYWSLEMVSPNLTNLEYWQKALGFRVKLAHCMRMWSGSNQTGATVYCNVIVDLYDHTTQTVRAFTYPATATPLTYSQYGVGNTWNERAFLWSSVPGFPTNFTLQRIYVKIWGRLWTNYLSGNNGSVFVDHIMPVWPFWDFNADGKTSLPDFSAFSSAWLTQSSDLTWNPVFDYSPGNLQVDIYDLRDFINNWLRGR